MPKLLRTEHVCEMLDIQPHRLYRMAAAGLIPAIRVGREWRFDEAKLRAWMDAGGAGAFRMPALRQQPELAGACV